MLAEAAREWRDDRASRCAAALAYYTSVSVAPLVVLLLVLVAAVWGEEAASGQLTTYLNEIMGASQATLFQEIIAEAKQPTLGSFASVLSIGVLIWGADQEGGAPYVYPSDGDKSQVTGFEVDLAAALAQSLGAKAQFFQGPWDQMPSLLATRKVHVVLNGYEWTPARAEAMAATTTISPLVVFSARVMAAEMAARSSGVKGWATTVLPSTRCAAAAEASAAA